MEDFGLRISPEQAEDSRIAMSSITKGRDTVPLLGHWPGHLPDWENLVVLASSVVCEAGLYLFWEQVTRLVLRTVKGEVGIMVTGKCGRWGLTPAEPLPHLPPGRCEKTPWLRKGQFNS